MQMKKKIAIVVSVVALVALAAIGATLAWFTDSKDVTNVVTMGNVQIKLEEPQFTAAHADNTITDVVPNQSIVKDPTITNTGKNDAYVRVQVAYTGLTDEQIAQLEAGLHIDGDLWVKSGDYYYYQGNDGVLAAGSAAVQVFDKVVIPYQWGNEMVNKTFEINVSAQAIQAANFTPVTDANGVITSWGDPDPLA